MGDIADMMLEGLLDEETGEYIGDVNEGIYGVKSPGFPISYERENREFEVLCSACNKPLKIGDEIQCFLASPDDPEGSWSKPVILDSGWPERAKRNNDEFSRKHKKCSGENPWSK